MKLKLNIRDEEIPSSKKLLSVNKLLNLKSFINIIIIQDENYDILQIKEADDVKMMHIFGRG